VFLSCPGAPSLFLAPPFSSATAAENPTKNLVAAAVEFYYGKMSKIVVREK
jgi:hypothetical protein